MYAFFLIVINKHTDGDQASFRDLETNHTRTLHALKKFNFHAYHVTVVQPLEIEDVFRRMNFVARFSIHYLNSWKTYCGQMSATNKMTEIFIYGLQSTRGILETTGPNTSGRFTFERYADRPAPVPCKIKIDKFALKSQFMRLMNDKRLSKNFRLTDLERNCLTCSL